MENNPDINQHLDPELVASQEDAMHSRNNELMGFLVDQELPEEQKVEITRRFSGLVGVIATWAEENDEQVNHLTPLGGGFKNPVLLITTSKGRQVVAKGFTEQESLDTTRRARTAIDEIIDEDMRIIPEADIFSDTLFSEKAKGSPVKNLIKELSSNPETFDRTAEALFAVGSTLGMIHERTERPINDDEDLDQETLELVLTDTEKALRHIDELEVARLTGLDEEDIELIKSHIKELTIPEFVSLVHGDAHLDQFFHEAGGATVEIVDYDDLREGDPMADIGRLIASQRDWCRIYGVDEDTEMQLTRAIVLGYESTRQESELSEDAQELDVMRVVAYELRLHLVKLKNYSQLRERISTIGKEIGLSESEILVSDNDTQEVVARHLNEEEIEQYQSLRTLSSELSTILRYIKPVSADKIDEEYGLAA